MPDRLPPLTPDGPEFQLRPLRVRRARLKVPFVLATGVVVYALVTATAGANPVVATLGALVNLGWWVMLARCLRAEGEPMNPPRPWWQATYRHPASFALAAYQAFGVVWGGSRTWAFLPYLPPADAVAAVVPIVVGAGLVAFYLNSAVRLWRRAVTAGV